MNNFPSHPIFEWDPKNEILEIHGNAEGLKKIRDALDLLIKSPGNDHSHLMTSEWGGNELSSQKQNDNDCIINHVKISKWENI